MDKPKYIITNKKLCHVCGDKASCFNFNALSCESCKAFFRRTVYKKDLKCEIGNCCDINRITRANCVKCRFDKCVAIGMKKELVSCLSVRRINPFKPNPIVHQIDRISLFSNERTLNLKLGELSRLGELYKAVQAFPSESSWQIVGQVDSVPQLVNLAVANIKYTTQFCTNIYEFNLLSKDEQVIALKPLLHEINQIKSAFVFNIETNGWAALDNSECNKRALFVKMDLLKSLTSKEIFKFYSNFIIDLHREMENDFVIRDLLLVQLVFKHRPKMDNFEFMRYHNVVFRYLLLRYLEHKYLDKKRATQKFAKLMSLFAKIDPIANVIGEFFSKTQIHNAQVGPVLNYNFHQTK